MKRNQFLFYSVALSAISFALALVVSASAIAVRRTIHTMIGDLPLPWVTTASLSASPVFFVLAVVFLGLGVASILRPALLGSLLHACLLALVAELSALCVAAGGVLFFFSTLDSTMSP